MGLTRQERYDKEKSKNKLKSDSATTTFMPQEATGVDPLSQPAVVKGEPQDTATVPASQKLPEDQDVLGKQSELEDEDKEDEMAKETLKEDKKPTDEEGNLIKAEEKPEDEETKRCKMEDLDDEDDDSEKEDEELTEEEKKKKKKKAKKGDGSGESPEEDTASATDDNSSTSPGMGVPSTQNVFVPNSNITVPGTVASGDTPSESTFSGKSVRTNLMKSPLFVNINKQLDEMRKSYEKKLTAMEKSMADRLTNITKTLKNVEEFYNKPLYKGFAENVNPEAVRSKTISKQLEDGKVRFSN